MQQQTHAPSVLCLKAVSAVFFSVFLAEQFESLQSHLDTMMPAAKKPFLQQFYSQVYSHLLPEVFVITGSDNHVITVSWRQDCTKHLTMVSVSYGQNVWTDLC